MSICLPTPRWLASLRLMLWLSLTAASIPANAALTMTIERLSNTEIRLSCTGTLPNAAPTTAYHIGMAGLLTGISGTPTFSHIYGSPFLASGSSYVQYELYQATGTPASTTILRMNLSLTGGAMLAGSMNITVYNATWAAVGTSGTVWWGQNNNVWQVNAGTYSVIAPSAPTALTLSATSLAENVAAGSTVGTFTSTDAVPNETFAYSLPANGSYPDNAAFSISGNALVINGSPNYETKSSYSILARTTDGTGLFYDKAFTISIVNVFEVTVTQTNTCYGAATGMATVQPPTEGTAPYGYDWSPGTPAGDGTASISALAAGTYSVTVTDAGGQTATRTVTITQPSAALSATTGQTNPTCGLNNGTATVTASGGTGPYAYSWNTTPAQTTATATNLPPGTYEAIVSDANSCTVTRTFTLTATPDNSAPVAVTKNLIIALPASGTATITAAQVDNNSTDNCGIVTRSVVPNTFTCANMSTSVPAPNSYVLSFAASQSQSFALGSALMPGSADYTVEAWVYTRQSGNQAILGRNSGANSHLLWINSSKLTAGNGGAYTATQEPTNFPTNQWVHVAVTYKTNGEMKLYRNGALVQTITNSVSYGASTVASFLGSFDNSSIYWDGYMDEVRVWSVARTDAEILNNRSMVLTGTETGLRAYYNFENGPASGTAVDVTGHGYTGTQATTSKRPTWVAASSVAGLALTMPGVPVTLTLTDAAGNNSSATAYVGLTTGTASAPTALSLSNATLVENVPAGTTVGTFSSTDPNACSTFTYALVSGAGSTDNAAFTLTTGGSLTINAAPNYEAKSSYSLRVQTTDNAGLTFAQVVTVSVTDIDEGPEIANPTRSVAENTAIGANVGTALTATDPEGGTTVTGYAIMAGNTGGAFALNATTGQLTVAGALDFESISSYALTVEVSDGTISSFTTVTVNLTNVNEVPTALALSNATLNENTGANAVVGTLSTTDPDAAGTFTYSLPISAGYPDNALLNISGNQLRITTSPDYETQRSYSVLVRTTDQGGLFTEQAFMVTINDLLELLSLNPARNARAASRSTTVGLLFSDTITLSSAGTIKVFSDQYRGRRTTTVGVSGGAVTLTPTAPGSPADFKPGETLFVTVPATVQTPNGLFFRPQVYQFTAAVSTPTPGVFPGAGSNPSVSAVPTSVATADVDGDGDLDLLTANGGNATVSVRLNNGSGIFSGTTNVSVGSGPNTVIAADVDSDGDLDLLTSNYINTVGTRTLSVRFNDGNGTFSGTTDITVADIPTGLRAADVDADGDLDLLVANYTPKRVSILFNDGSGAFSGLSTVAVDAEPLSVTAADVDGDGDLDILTPNNGNPSTVSVRLNNGQGVFAGGSTVATGSYSRNVEAVDLDADGDLDLLVGNNSGSVSVRFNNGSGTFSGGSDVGTGGSTARVTAADVDGDGDFDFMAANTNNPGRVSVHYNNGSGTFSGSTSVATGNFPTGVVAADVDNDGDLDMLVAPSDFISEVNVRLNVKAPTITSFTPLSGLPGTSVVITGTDFHSVSAVRFNGTPATTYTVNSPTQLTATVPTGATTGLISVTTSTGTGSSTTNFVVGLALTGSQVHPSCGLANGTATVTPTGGTLPFAYSWDTTPAQATATATGLGAGTYTATVTDGSGATATYSVTLTAVADNTAPVAVAQNLTMALPASGILTLTGAQVDNGSTDNCGIVSRSVTPNTFTCADAGAVAPNTYFLNFNGSQYFGMGTTLMPGGADYTVEAWVYARQTNGRMVLGRNQSGNSHVFWVNGNKLTAGNATSYTAVADPTNFPVNTWTHVAVTYKTNGELKVYRDGTLVNSITNSVNYGAATVQTFMGSFDGSLNWDGYLDEMRVWSEARTQAEIQASKNVMLTGTEANLRAYYNFENGPAAGTAVDVTGHGYTGTQATTATRPTWVATSSVAGPALTSSGVPVTLTVTDAAGNSSTATARVVVNTGTTAAPTGVSLNSPSVAENVAAGTLVSTLSTTDPNACGSYTYALVSGGVDNFYFSLTSGGNLTINSSPNYEAKSSYSIRVRTTDQTSLSFTQTLTVTVTNVNEAPTINSQSRAVAENSANGTTVGSAVTASDPEGAATLSYSITAGNTGNVFAINPTTGQLTVAGALNYEATSSYALTVVVTDGTFSASATVTVFINNVNEAPTALSLNNTMLSENVPALTTVGAMSTTDPDGTFSFTYSLPTNASYPDNAGFSISGSSLRVRNSPDYEVKGSYSILVRTTDQNGLFFEQPFTITITNVNEAPALSSQTFSLAENSPNGTVVGTVPGSDPDAGSALSYSILSGNMGGAFALNAGTGQLTVADVALLDYETTPTFTLTVQVSDGSLTADATVTVNLTDAVEDLLISTPQTVPAGTYSSLTVTGTGVATLGGNLSINGPVVVQSGGVLADGCHVLSGAGSFTLAADATLRICNPQGLSATGAMGAVQITGTRNYSPHASYEYTGGAQITGLGLPAQVHSLTKAGTGTLTLSAPVAVRQLLTVSGSGDFDLNGLPLTLRSDADTTAYLLNTGAGRVLGATATVQRYLSAATNPGLGYRHLSAPVQGSTVGDLATTGFTPKVKASYNNLPTPSIPASQFPTVFGFDETHGGTNPAYAGFDYGYVSPLALTDGLVPGRGQMVYIKGGLTPDFVGTLTQDDVTLSLTRTGTPGADPNNTKAGWHLLGNPFASLFDWDLVSKPAALAGTMSVFRSTGVNAGAFLVRTNGVGGIANGIVAPGQAFFVRLDGTGPVDLTLPNSARVNAPATVVIQRPAAAVDTRPLVRLTLRGATAPVLAQDEAFVYFEAGATAGRDSQFDGQRPAHNVGAVPTLSTLTAVGEELAVNGLPETALTAGTSVALRLDLPTAGSYSLHAAELRNLPVTAVALLDRLTSTHYDLTATPTVTFTAAQAGPLSGRFVLVFGATTTVTGHSSLLPPASGFTVYPNPASAAGTVQLTGVSGRQVELLNVVGQRVRTALVSPQGDTATLELTGLPAGVYTIRTAAGSRQLVVE